MKKGDVLICKKDKDILYKKNNNYIVCEKLLNYYGNDFIQILYTPEFGEWFILNNNENHKYIWDYFYTTEELRKLKLESL